MTQTKLLSIDQGTTSSRAIVFDASGKPLEIAQREFKQIFPASGWVEHDPEEIWSSTRAVCQQVIANYPEIAAIGITNQRETTVVWDRQTGEPIYNAIVWQDRRTADICQQYKTQNHEPTIKQKTGLLLDPYFSASKIAWILDNVDGARARANKGELACGTIDSFLIWRLTEGRVHATDATNASRTSLFNIHTQKWDDALLQIFNVPAALLPQVKDCAADYGLSCVSGIGIEAPIAGVAGDQQAASIGQCCFKPGMIKSTYGTGCFAMMNTGTQAVTSENGLLTTIAYRLNGQTHYALEGSIFIAGAAVQWLRDALKLVNDARETEALANTLESNEDVYFVPAFVGLGAPYWNPHARGAIFGLTRNTGPAHLSRAALESVCYQTHDLIKAMRNDSGVTPEAIKIDGGMVNNDWLCQTLADVLDIAAERPTITETTALGAAYLAGLQIGLFQSTEALASLWQLNKRFVPAMADEQRTRQLKRWHQAVAAVNTMSQH